MALQIYCSAPEADYPFNFRHLPPGPDLRKDPRPVSIGSPGSYAAPRTETSGPLRSDRATANKYHTRQRRLRHQTWALDAEDGKDLAASEVPLPSYTGVAGRGLKRQEAFVNEATCKRRLVNAQREAEASHDLSASDAELINLGILYNDEHLRGAGVTLNTIVHDNSPVYTIRHTRQRRHRNLRTANRTLPTKKAAPVLPLDLSLNELGQDAAIAAFMSGSYIGFDDEMSNLLMSPDTTELDANGEDEVTPRRNDFCFPAPDSKGLRKNKSGRFAHLEVIYEAEDPKNDNEVDMIEGELDDEPSDTQIPDDDLFYDWASVSGASLTSSQVELDFENDDEEKVVPAVDSREKEMSAHKRVDPWVVLAGDS